MESDGMNNARYEDDPRYIEILRDMIYFSEEIDDAKLLLIAKGTFSEARARLRYDLDRLCDAVWKKSYGEIVQEALTNVIKFIRRRVRP